MKTRLGTNQYKRKYTVQKRAIVLTLPLALLVYASWRMFIFSIKSVRTLKNPAVWILIFTLFFASSVSAQAPKADLTHEYVAPHQMTEHEEIIAYINQVFGKDAPKAFKLLSCENHALNPYALNNNETWGGVGKDYGIFQINNKWQGVTNEAFLYDWKINIDMAHNIYTRDHNTFKLWTCGRALEI